MSSSASTLVSSGMAAATVNTGSPKYVGVEPPLGVSFEFLRRFLDFPQLSATDARVGQPVLDLIRNAPGDYWSSIKRKFKGLPSPIQDLLDLAELKELAGELRITPTTDDVNELAKPDTWANALHRPANTTADVVMYAVVKPDTFGGGDKPSEGH